MVDIVFSNLCWFSFFELVHINISFEWLNLNPNHGSEVAEHMRVLDLIFVSSHQKLCKVDILQFLSSSINFLSTSIEIIMGNTQLISIDFVPEMLSGCQCLKFCRLSGGQMSLERIHWLWVAAFARNILMTWLISTASVLPISHVFLITWTRSRIW